jgi:DNA helicase-4
VELHPQSTEEVYEKIVIYDENFGKELRTLVETFINLAKSNRYTRDDLIEMFANIDEVSEFMRVRQDLFLDFILPAFQIYDNVLTEKNEIDFNDMINQATDLIGKNPSGVEKYDYIIVDEYQDISVARFGLIEKIRDISSARLISVGDDWQSIYRFAGSDISLFSSYGDFVDGEYEELFIERTYRNSQELIDISKRFIEQNTLQIKKEPKSDKTIEVPIEFTRYENASAVSTIIDTLLKIIKKGGADQKILILGRHSFDIDTYLEDGRVELDKETGKITVEELRVSIDI